MAAPLSQDEIDALLNSTEDAIEGGDDSVFEPDIAEAEPRKGGTKNFEIPVEDPYRFKFNYNSPVIKCKGYVYNPEEEPVEEQNGEEKLVVRSIFNYATTRKKC